MAVDFFLPWVLPLAGVSSLSVCFWTIFFLFFSTWTEFGYVAIFSAKPPGMHIFGRFFFFVHQVSCDELLVNNNNLFVAIIQTTNILTISSYLYMT